MTPLQYINQNKIASLTEINAAKKEDPTILATLVRWAREEMANKGIEITEPAHK